MIAFLALFHLMVPIMGLFWLGVRAEREQMVRERVKIATLAIWSKNGRRGRRTY